MRDTSWIANRLSALVIGVLLWFSKDATIAQAIGLLIIALVILSLED